MLGGTGANPLKKSDLDAGPVLLKDRIDIEGDPFVSSGAHELVLVDVCQWDSTCLFQEATHAVVLLCRLIDDLSNKDLKGDLVST